MTEKRQVKQTDCEGCRNEIYNQGKVPGVDQCWAFKNARMRDRIAIGIDEPPPYKDKDVIMKPDCYHQEGANRSIWLDPSKLGPDGFWK